MRSSKKGRNEKKQIELEVEIRRKQIELEETLRLANEWAHKFDSSHRWSKLRVVDMDVLVDMLRMLTDGQGQHGVKRRANEIAHLIVYMIINLNICTIYFYFNFNYDFFKIL